MSRDQSSIALPLRCGDVFEKLDASMHLCIYMLIYQIVYQ